MNETWLPIEGFNGYEVSDFGRIRSLKSGKFTLLKWQMRGQYPGVRLFRKGLGKRGHREAVHRFVARAFIGPIPEGHQINHKDGIKTNPRLENLEIVTASANNWHAYHVLGRLPQQGSKHGRSRLKEDQVVQILERKRLGVEQRTIAKEFGVCEGTISMIVNRVRWTHVSP